MLRFSKPVMFKMPNGNYISFINKRKFYSLKSTQELLMDNLGLFLSENKKLLIIGIDPVEGTDAGLFPDLKEYGIDITVLDIVKTHCEWAEQAYKVKTINIDAVNFNNFNEYGCVWWRHGPEHVTKEEFNIINNKVGTNFIIECPWGDTTNLDGLSKEEKENNKGLGHVSAWEAEEFMRSGFIMFASNENTYMNGRPHIFGFRLGLKLPVRLTGGWCLEC
jgi:hypothetical protein